MHQIDDDDEDEMKDVGCVEVMWKKGGALMFSFLVPSSVLLGLFFFDFKDVSVAFSPLGPHRFFVFDASGLASFFSSSSSP